jgi:hypothetical protein
MNTKRSKLIYDSKHLHKQNLLCHISNNTLRKSGAYKTDSNNKDTIDESTKDLSQRVKTQVESFASKGAKAALTHTGAGVGALVFSATKSVSVAIKNTTAISTKTNQVKQRLITNATKKPTGQSKVQALKQSVTTTDKANFSSALFIAVAAFFLVFICGFGQSALFVTGALNMAEKSEQKPSDEITFKGQKRIVDRAWTMPALGSSTEWLCLGWVSSVYLNAGISRGYLSQPYAALVYRLMHKSGRISNDLSELVPGMVIVSDKYAWMILGEIEDFGGHIGIYVGDNIVRSCEGGVMFSRPLDEFIAIFGSGGAIGWGWPSEVIAK